jgi:hypothetical protein
MFALLFLVALPLSLNVWSIMCVLPQLTARNDARMHEGETLHYTCWRRLLSQAGQNRTPQGEKLEKG